MALPGLAALAGVSTTRYALAAAPKRKYVIPLFNSTNAPDRISREVLAGRIDKLHHGALAGMDPAPAIHRNFPQIIEQNFAGRDAARIVRMLDNLGDSELSDLAQLYVNATADKGHSPRLLDILALRLDPVRLGRVSKHFGFAPTYEAVTRTAPAKSQDFMQHTDPNLLAPIPGAAHFGPNGRLRKTNSGNLNFDTTRATRGAMLKTTMGPRDNWMRKVGLTASLELTIYEIYLDFRTAPIGSLGVRAAIFETTLLVSGATGLAWQAGTWAGTNLVGPFIQWVSPTTWDAIGGTINQIVENLERAASGVDRGNAEAEASTYFQLGPIAELLEATGGDYAVCQPWSDWSDGGGGGGGGRDCQWCVLA